MAQKVGEFGSVHYFGHLSRMSPPARLIQALLIP